MKTSKVVTIFSMLLVVILCCVVSALAAVTAFTVNKDNTVTDIDVNAIMEETEEDEPLPPPIHCSGKWGQYSPCIDGKMSREFEISYEANETGIPCPSPLIKTYPCTVNEEQHCLGAWRDFEDCVYQGVEQVYGTKSQSYKIIKPKIGKDSRECRHPPLTGDIVEDGQVNTTTCEKPCSDDEKVGNVGDISAWSDEVIVARCQKCTGQSEADCKAWLNPTCEIGVAEHGDGTGDTSGWRTEGWGNSAGDVIMDDKISSYRTKGPEDCRFKAYERLLDHPDGSGESIVLPINPHIGVEGWHLTTNVPDGWNDRISALQITGGGRRDFSLDAAWRNVDSDSDSD